MGNTAVAVVRFFKVSGIAEELEVFEDKLTITPRGEVRFLDKDLKRTKTIPFRSIAAIQHKKAGVTAGYLQFSPPSRNESKGRVFAAASDENTFMYSRNENAVIEEVKEFIEGRARALRADQRARSGGSVADELSKLADLHKQGILSADEFAQAKKQLLAR